MVIISSVVVGLIVGWIAGLVMEANAYNLVRDVFLGMTGGLLGGWIASSWLNLTAGANIITQSSILMAFAGAVILIALRRIFFIKRRRVEN
ncbi:MAG: GlsB/YeaQ/YmgE family stress response membrane protein [Anaerolineaceae bacterium]|nr:GlsB/YeaQ/YmgE family stress response membrane protein [Anaerolineaceae bacterium]